jgi:putative N-acetyltransferase (TIGR04045 family)
MGTVRSRWSSAPDTLRLVCRPADNPGELAAHHRIRHAVFVAEQGLFPLDDRDIHDADGATIHVLGLDDGIPAGTVRLYPLGDGIWKGDRLAVLPEHRHGSGLGGPLVRYAVSTAGTLGGSLMVAQVQAANVRFFQALGWTAVGDPADYLGLLHQKMSIALR